MIHHEAGGLEVGGEDLFQRPAFIAAEELEGEGVTRKGVLWNESSQSFLRLRSE
jgi:hypothetical protein